MAEDDAALEGRAPATGCRSRRRVGVGGRPGPQGRARASPPAPRRPVAGCAARPRHRAASRFTMVQAKRASEAEGAGESGLHRLIQMHVFNTAGDAAVAISLAGSLFFQVPSGEARDQVALFLGLTMLPFAIVAPLIGPFLDRFAHGRRWAIGATMAVRAFLCWALASSIEQRLGAGLRRRARRPGLVQGLRRDPGRRRTPPAPPRLHPGQGQRPGLAVRHRRRLGLGADRRPSPRWSARSGRCATRRCCSSIATVCAIRLPAEVDSSEGEGEMSCAARRAAPRGAGGGAPGSPARSRSRCAPTAGRGSSAASC